MEYINTENAPKAIGPYSQAICVNNMIYTSGQIAISPETNSLVEGDILAQTEQVLKNLEQVLLASGSSLDKIIKTTVFVTDISKFSLINEIYGKYITCKPARSLVEVNSLPKGALIEIEAIAYR